MNTQINAQTTNGKKRVEVTTQEAFNVFSPLIGKVPTLMMSNGDYLALKVDSEELNVFFVQNKQHLITQSRHYIIKDGYLTFALWKGEGLRVDVHNLKNGEKDE